MTWSHISTAVLMVVVLLNLGVVVRVVRQSRRYARQWAKFLQWYESAPRL